MNRRGRAAALAGGLALLALAGCQTVEIPRYYQDYFSTARLQQHWLPALDDHVTTRAQVETALGPPSRQYEDGRLAAYRLILNDSPPMPRHHLPLKPLPAVPTVVFKDPVDRQLEKLSRNGKLSVVTETNDEERLPQIVTAVAEYSLVLVYNSSGLLVRHALERRQP